MGPRPWMIPALAIALAAFVLGFAAGRLIQRQPSATSSAPPSWSLDGYKIGDRWEDVGRGLPCDIEDVAPGSAARERKCSAGPGLDLYFTRAGRLAYMMKDTSWGNQPDARRLWRTVRPWARRIVGDPDSVTDAHSIGELGNRLYAVWFPREDGTCAKLEVLSGLGGLDPGARDRTVLTITGDCTR